jgi:hypothetical protein
MIEETITEYLTRAASLRGKGWFGVDYPHGFESRYHAIEIGLWCEENLGNFMQFGRTFYFEKESDAVMFLLRMT